MKRPNRWTAALILGASLLATRPALGAPVLTSPSGVDAHPVPASSSSFDVDQALRAMSSVDLMVRFAADKNETLAGVQLSKGTDATLSFHLKPSPDGGSPVIDSFDLEVTPSARRRSTPRASSRSSSTPGSRRSR
jgi:hypothetical protein